MVAPLIIARVASVIATRAAVEGGAELGEAITGELEAKGQSVMLPVSSEAISAIGWDADAEEIIVVFHRGGDKTYTYPGSVEEFAAFAMSPSKGQYFNAHFK